MAQGQGTGTRKADANRTAGRSTGRGVDAAGLWTIAGRHERRGLAKGVSRGTHGRNASRRGRPPKGRAALAHPHPGSTETRWGSSTGPQNTVPSRGAPATTRAALGTPRRASIVDEDIRQAPHGRIRDPEASLTTCNRNQRAKRQVTVALRRRFERGRPSAVAPSPRSR